MGKVHVYVDAFYGLPVVDLLELMRARVPGCAAEVGDLGSCGLEDFRRAMLRGLESLGIEWNVAVLSQAGSGTRGRLREEDTACLVVMSARCDDLCGIDVGDLLSETDEMRSCRERLGVMSALDIMIALD